MTIAAVSVTAVATVVPAGRTFAHWLITVSDSASPPNSLSQTVDGVATQSATFDISNFAAGPGTAMAVAIDSTGANLGNTATSTFTIPQPATFPQPTTITVTVS